MSFIKIDNLRFKARQLVAYWQESLNPNGSVLALKNGKEFRVKMSCRELDQFLRKRLQKAKKHRK